MIRNRHILAISPFENWPLSQGAIVRTHYLIRHLLRQNDVWFAHRRGARRRQDGLALRGRLTNHSQPYLQLFNPLFLFRLWLLVRRERIDLILVSHLWSGIHGLCLRLLTGRRLLVETHNVEYMRLRRMGHRAWPLVWLAEFVIYRGADEIFSVSETDRRYLMGRLRVPGERIRVVPNGADVHGIMARQVNEMSVKRRLALGPDERFALFFGSLGHTPNAQAATIILDELEPRLREADIDAVIVIAGPGQAAYLASRSAPPPQVRFAGFVEDIVALVKSAHVVLVPLVSGSGTRFKIIEAVACGRPVISTTVGAEGLDRQALGEFLTIRDEWDGFASAVEEILAKAWNRPVPAPFIARYDWEAVFAGV